MIRVRSARMVALATATITLMGVAHVSTQSPRSQRPDATARDGESDTVTFTKDIAPIVFEHCSPCHRPGGIAPFSLLGYEDVKGRGTHVAMATHHRDMPPWKPEPGYGAFVGERRLSDDRIALIQRWVADGMREGDPAALPPLPRWSDRWQLGEPDVVVGMPEPYILRATGDDIFRNFVIPIPTSVRRYVKAWEFRPGNSRIVHHATMQIDPTPASWRLDEEDPEPGYEGLIPFSAHHAPGYFLGWTPGQTAYVASDEMAWPLEQNSHLVMMLHLRSSGREEQLQASFGLFFSDVPPSHAPVMLRLGRQHIDIPPGDPHYIITDSYRLPVDAEVHSVQPHAHNLAREIKGFATLPDGTTRWLIYIKNWDFNWQDVYRYVNPIVLPAGTTLALEYTYDNSVANPRNPHHPPQRVTYGQKTSNEMGDLWVPSVDT